MKELYFHSKEIQIPGKKGNYKITFSGNLSKDHDLFIGHSLCSPKDNFCKKIGRKIAAGRSLNTKNCILISDFKHLFDEETQRYNEPLTNLFIEECIYILDEIKQGNTQYINTLFPDTKVKEIKKSSTWLKIKNLFK